MTVLMLEIHERSDFSNSVIDIINFDRLFAPNFKEVESILALGCPFVYMPLLEKNLARVLTFYTVFALFSAQ